MLVDDGKLSSDDKVRQHLDYFRLADERADREVTLRDLLSHRIFAFDRCTFEVMFR